MPSFARDRLTPTVANGLITLQLASGPRFEEKLHDKTDIGATWALRDRISAFCRQHGATIGQRNAAYKALTENGYHVRPRGLEQMLALLTEEQRRRLLKEQLTKLHQP